MDDKKAIDLALGDQDEITKALQTAESAVSKIPTQVIGPNEIKKAEELLQRYKQGKAALETRLIENEKWYKQRHWTVIKEAKSDNNPESTSAWLFNSIANKHADAMDNYPNPVVLPREKSDEQDAKTLSSILPVILEENGYEQTYSDAFWSKLKGGTGVKGIFWDKYKLNGLGDITIRETDLLNLFWEPGAKRIQESANLFHVELWDVDAIKRRYPKAENITGGNSEAIVAKYQHDEDIDTSEKVAVVDWYYKVQTESGKTILHYCKFCNGVLLFASENDEKYAKNGWYDHGKYPFVFDTLFPEKDMPVGFGYIDIVKNPQLYIDKLDGAIILHAWQIANQRYFLRGDGKVNETEFADMTNKFVHFTGSGNPNESIFPITVPSMTADVLAVRTQKIEELKETSGNRDFSQGSTASGVTAASAIAALQEAGSKLSRDMIKSSYRANKEEAYFCIELIRQFYTEGRTFRITGENGGTEYVTYSGMSIAQSQQGDGVSQDVVRVPIFDIQIVAQKQSPFSTVAQNERAKEMYAAGFFRPDNADQALAALMMMQFEGIDAIKERIANNGTLYQKMLKLTPLIIAMAQQLDTIQGTKYTPQVAKILGITIQASQTTPGVKGKTTKPDQQSNTLGDTFQEAESSTAGAARQRAAANSTPRA